MNDNGNADGRQGIQEGWKEEIHQSTKILNKLCADKMEHKYFRVYWLEYLNFNPLNMQTSMRGSAKQSHPIGVLFVVKWLRGACHDDWNILRQMVRSLKHPR